MTPPAALRVAAAAAAFALLPVTARAAPSPAGTPVVLTLDGRPLTRDRDHRAAFRRNGVVYANVADLVQSFNGLLLYHAQGRSVTVTISGVTASFAGGSRTARVGETNEQMPGQPIGRYGDLYVPLQFFVRRLTSAHVRSAGRFADIVVPASP